jgi:hypothetical protein
MKKKINTTVLKVSFVKAEQNKLKYQVVLVGHFTKEWFIVVGEFIFSNH